MNPSNGLRGARAAAACVAVVGLVALSACGSDSSGDGTGTGAASSVQAPPGSFPGKVATGAPVKIGLINNEGGQAISQPENRETAEAAVRYANDNLGGIGGRPIQLTICKEQEEPASARDCANQMVEAKVSAVVVTSTGLGNIIAPIITNAGIPYVSTSGQSPAELTGDNSHLWTGGFPESLKAMAKYAGEQKMRNVTAYTIDVPAAVSGLSQLGVPAFKAAGVDLKVVTIPLGTPDATPQVSAGLDSDPQGVVIVGESTFCTSVLKPLGTLGSTAKKMSIQNCVTPTVVSAVGDAVNDMKVFSAAETVGNHPETALYQAIIAKYSPKTDISGYAYVGYQGMLGLVRATATVQGADTSAAAIGAAIKAAKYVVLPAGGGLTFTCDGSAEPTLKAVCGKGSIVLTVKDRALTDPQVITD